MDDGRSGRRAAAPGMWIDAWGGTAEPFISPGVKVRVSRPDRDFSARLLIIAGPFSKVYLDFYCLFMDYLTYTMTANAIIWPPIKTQGHLLPPSPVRHGAPRQRCHTKLLCGRAIRSNGLAVGLGRRYLLVETNTETFFCWQLNEGCDVIQWCNNLNRSESATTGRYLSPKGDRHFPWKAGCIKRNRVAPRWDNCTGNVEQGVGKVRRCF